MEFRGAQARRPEPAPDAPRATPGRVAAFGSLLAVAAVLVVIVMASSTGSRSHTSSSAHKHARGSVTSRSTPAPKPITTVPILSYNIINVQPPQSAAPAGLYVPASEFTAQMNALKANGWHAVTLDQLQANWIRGVSLGSGKPIVVAFDSGYASQFTNALPVLKQLGWPGVENIQVSGLPPSEGGLTDAQIRGLLAAGWELDTEGISQSDLTGLGPTALSSEVAGARQTLRTRYSVPVNWFAYPGGRYNPTVVAAVRTAGFAGATTIVSGWASPQADRFRLPRLRVVGGTSPSMLLSQIASAERITSAPAASQGP